MFATVLRLPRPDPPEVHVNSTDSPMDHLRKASGWDIFERRTPYEPYGYKLTMPGVMIDGDPVELSFANGMCTATQRDEDGRIWTGTASFEAAAILALIADRMGFTATIEPKPEEPADA